MTASARANFRALFESIERDQIRRGVLTPDAPARSRAHRARMASHPQVTGRARAGLAFDPAGFELVLQQPDGAEFGIAAKDGANNLGLAVYDDELAILHPIAER